jgi:hypothetical protein
MTKPQFILTLLILSLTACSSWPPAGFWTDFDEAHQVEKFSDQGPWGGTRVIHWKADEVGTFSPKAIIREATENGWNIVDDTSYDDDVVSKWTFSNKPIFPIQWTGFHPTEVPNTSKHEDFPRWTTGDVRVLSFTTDYINIEPGSGEDYDINGFALFDREGKELTIYHMWGE